MTQLVKSYFPSQVVVIIEKISYEYGLKVAQAIEAEWFGKRLVTQIDLV